MTRNKLPDAMPLAQRLETRHRVNADTGCWEWTGPTTHDGYGRTTWKATLPEVLVHRIAYKLLVREPGELCVLHSCDNRPCFNPEHLFLGTRADNNADMVAKGRQAPLPDCPAERRQRGAAHYHARFSEADVLAIRADRRAVKIVARDYGCSLGAVHNIQARRTWGHLEEVSA
jgi:hypothetical protein